MSKEKVCSMCGKFLDVMECHQVGKSCYCDDCYKQKPHKCMECGEHYPEKDMLYELEEMGWVCFGCLKKAMGGETLTVKAMPETDAKERTSKNYHLDLDTDKCRVTGCQCDNPDCRSCTFSFGMLHIQIRRLADALEGIRRSH